MADEKQLPAAPDRKTFIGGSDAAAVMGLSRYRTPLNVYFQKRGETDPNPPPPDPQREKRLLRGKLMEPVVIEMLRREYPIDIVRASTEAEPIYYYDKRAPYLAAQIDFEWQVTKQIIEAFPQFVNLPLGSMQNGEVKTAHPFATGEWGEQGTDEMPIEYAIQGFHGIGVTDRQAALVILLVGSDNLIPFQVLRNEKVVQGVHEKLTSFWNKNVLAGVAPDPVVLADVYNLLRRKANVEIQATVEMIGLVAELVRAKKEEKELEARMDTIQLALGKAILGEATVEAKELETRHRLLLGKEPLLTISSGERSSIKIEDLVKQFPLAAALVKTSKFLTFRLPRPKKAK